MTRLTSKLDKILILCNFLFPGSAIFPTLRTTGLILRYRRMMSPKLRNYKKILKSTKRPIFIVWTIMLPPPRNRGLRLPFIAESLM